MKTDAPLKKHAVAELAWDPSVNATEVDVAVVDGVAGIANDIVLKGCDAPMYVADRIHDALLRDAEDDAAQIDVFVHGWHGDPDGTGECLGRRTTSTGMTT